MVHRIASRFLWIISINLLAKAVCCSNDGALLFENIVTTDEDADISDTSGVLNISFSVNGEFQPGINLPQGPVNDPSNNLQTVSSSPIQPPSHPNYHYYFTTTTLPSTSTTTTPRTRPTHPILLPHPTSTNRPIGDGGQGAPVIRPHDKDDQDLSKYCLQPRGQFAGRYCNTFVDCWPVGGGGGEVLVTAVEQVCGRTLMFNAPKGYCDYAANVNCQGRPIKELPTPAETGWPSDGSYVPPPSSTLSPPPRPAHPPQTTPPQFTIEPPGILFGGGGNYHHNKPSQASQPTTVSPPTTTTTTLRRFCLRPRGQFASARCDTFINCWDDVAIEQACPLGLYFNPAYSYCDFPYNCPCASKLPQ